LDEGADVSDRPDISGVINLYKPAGRTSAHFVYRLRPILGVRKVGHAGTLDPFADGVLLACVGRAATRLVERLMGLPKRYRTTLRLGVTNDTFDPERPLTPVPDAIAPGREAIEAALAPMIGDVEQTPPRYSAVRLGGVQSYKLARRADRASRIDKQPCESRPDDGGTTIEGSDAPLPASSPAPSARRVRIDTIDVVSYAWPDLTLDIRCGRGVYIRSIARDLGEALGCGAVCMTLSRTAVGPFTTERALRLEGSSRENVLSVLISVEDVMRMIESQAGG
jgi:tRNA pseudouridine55 synthase